MSKRVKTASKRFTFTLTGETAKLLTERARRDGISQADVVRASLKAYLNLTALTKAILAGRVDRLKRAAERINEA